MPTPPAADYSQRLATTDFVTQALKTKLNKSDDTVQGPLTVLPECLFLQGRQHWIAEDGQTSKSIRCAHDDLEVLNGAGSEVIFRLQNDGNLWLPVTGLLNEAFAAKANVGAECPHHTGIWEFGRVDIGHNETIADAPSPWVVIGLRAQINTYWTYLRAVKLRNQ